MRLLSVRLIFALLLGVTLVSLCTSYYEVQVERRRLRRELAKDAEVLSESLAASGEKYLLRESAPELERLVQRLGNREHLVGVAIYDAEGHLLAATPQLAQRITGGLSPNIQAILQHRSQNYFLETADLHWHIFTESLQRDNAPAGSLAVVHDDSYIPEQTAYVWRNTFRRVLVLGLMIVFITLLIIRWSVTGPIAHLAEWMRGLRTGRSSSRLPEWDFLRPLAREAATLADSLNRARSAAETEARLRDAAESLWTAERLAAHVRTRLGGSRLFVVSNREPYIHVCRGKAVEVMVPASGLVTALEPVLRACNGTWIAHGSGDGDREVVDKRDRLKVPPDEARYTLRRVWLNKEEEEGYYYGFSNEGLWPLCHIAHTRPVFRVSDWERYREVNRKFAEATLQEIKETENPVVLIQDYHFALLPRLVKEKRPDARVAIFWHIPWPNPEAFGICPWQRELLDGLLGADVVGFHVPAHCHNFLRTVDRALEARCDRDQLSVNRQDHLTIVRPFPISVEFTETVSKNGTCALSSLERAALLKELGVEAGLVGVGVDRVDYTKGILERFLAIERLLDTHPDYQGRFTFCQIGAPSRTHIKRYRDFMGEVEAEAERINWRFQRGKWKPIVFLKGQHNHTQIQRFYRSADLCLVTSLHDGMNLVAKEFIAARPDEQGVLVLSRFTGAAGELRDAVLVNPYDIDQTAEAIRQALEMSPQERRQRMQRLRKTVKEHNIYRWAGSLVAELCEVRPETPTTQSEPVGESVPAA